MTDAFSSPGRRVASLEKLSARMKITGFSSPAADYECLQPSIDELVGIGAPHIWLWRLRSEALAGLSLHANDTLVINRQTEISDGRIAVVVVEGEHRICLARSSGKSLSLVTVDLDGTIAELEASESVEVWGVVDFVVRDVRNIKF